MSGSSYSLVLVGTDGSDASFGAVDRAALIARDAGADLLLACAYHPMSEREVRDAQDALGGEPHEVSGSTPAEGVLRDAAHRAIALGVRDPQVHAVEGDAADGLLQLVEQRGVDLVVVGSRGLNGLAGGMLGSVPATISSRAACDVLIVSTTGRGAESRP